MSNIENTTRNSMYNEKAHTGCVIFLLFSIIILSLIVIFLCRPSSQDPKDLNINQTYHSTMKALINPSSVSVTDNKAVCYVYNLGRWEGFSRLYIPRKIMANKPEDARFIVYCYHEEEVVGVYGKYGQSNSSGPAAIEYYYQLTILDRLTGEYIATKEFRGGPAPAVSRGDTTGDPPKEDLIREWVLSSIQAQINK